MSQSHDLPTIRIRGARLLRFPSVPDARGTLTWGQTGTTLPFEPQRWWWITNVPPGQTRGDHALRRSTELLVCVHGRCRVTLDDGAIRDEVALDAPNLGLQIPPLIWHVQHAFSADAVLLALSNEPYRADDYIRDYDRFVGLATERR